MTKTVPFSIDGTKELERALFELPKATAKNAGRRALKEGAQPILDDFKARAPRLTGHLIDTSGISTKLSRRQSSLYRKEEDRDNVEMFVGAGPNPQAVQQEFGNEHNAAQPSLTPAWENNKRRSLDIIAKALRTNIKKSADRLARKAARLKAGG